MTEPVEDITPEYLVGCIREKSPVPAAWLRKARWLLGVAAALKKVLTEVEAEYRIVAEIILDNHMTDETYEMVLLTKEERMIDAEALRENNPVVYEQCASVDADMVAKILGGPTLRRMMIEKLGGEKVLPLEFVTIASVEELLGDEEFPEYVKTITVPNGHVIRKKEGELNG